MTSTSHDGVDFVSGASMSSTTVFELAIESATQYVNVDKLSYNFGVAAAYEVATLAELPAETHILNTYVGKVNGAAAVVGYELKLDASWDTGHGDAVIDGSVLLAINLADNKIAGAAVTNGGSMKNYSTKASEFATKLIGLDAAAVAAMTETSHEGADFVAGATVSSKEILALAAEACTQYASDKAVALLGYTAAYEVTTLAELPADSAILNTYVGKVDGVAKVIGYEVKVEFSFDTGHGDAVINGSFFITISLEDNTVVNSVLFNGGSMKNYTEKAGQFAAQLVGVDATVLATMSETSHDGLDFVSGATVSSKEVLKLAVAVANQYVNDKLTAGEVETEEVFVTHAGVDENIVNMVVEKVKSYNIFKNVYVTRAGATVSAHCGRNTLGILFVRKDKK